MISLFIDLCRGGTHTNRDIGLAETNDRKKGDVILAKLHDAIWSDKERAEGLIILYSDLELEHKLIKDGGVVAYPYKITSLDQNDKEVIDTISEYQVDLDMYLNSPGLDITNVTAEPVPPTQNSTYNDFLVKADLIHDPTPR